MTDHKCGLIYDPLFSKHITGIGHPEQPGRVTQTYKSLQKAGLTDLCRELTPYEAEEKELELVHHPNYLKLAQKDIISGRSTLSTGDTQICTDSWNIALRATGGLMQGIDEIFSNRLRRVFSLSRPPGHHATPSKGMGFCILNHIAIAARYAQKKYKVGKILIVDWDVHHGNGTQDIFYEDESVFFCSTHQHPWYPGTGSSEETGSGKGLGSTLNFPFPPGTGRKDLVEGALGEDLSKRINAFKPELILISAGFDSREGDPLGQFKLTDRDFFDLTNHFIELANSFCDGRILSVLEGGYDLSGLSSACCSHLKALLS